MQPDTTTDSENNTVLLIDVSVTVIAFLGSFWLRDFFIVGEKLSFSSHVFLLPLLVVLVTSFLSYFSAYDSPYNVSLRRYIWAITRSVILTVGILLSLLFFLKIEYVSRFVVLIFAILEIMALIIVRISATYQFKSQVKSGKKSLRVLIIGTMSRAQELVQELHLQTIRGVEVVGFIDPDPSLMGKIIKGVPIIGSVENIHDCLKDNVIDEVIIAIPRSLITSAEPIAHACEEEGIRLRFMADVFDVQVARISLTHIGNIPLLDMEPVSHDQQQLFAKRIFDLTLTVCALPFLIPLFLIIAIAIKLDSPGPVFFIQKRVGLRKHSFQMFKFRSMCQGAENAIKELEHLNEAVGPIFKISNDPRITRVGCFLRKSSLDELPQLINVLRGEMSLVGPRPMSIRDVDLFDRGVQRKRFSVRPGITCLWQISGRSNLPFEKWLELDLEYIENWSFWYDVKILFKTIPVVLKTKGAM